MKYDFKVVIPPRIHSFCPLNAEGQMYENVRNEKTINFEVSEQTKTSLNVSVYAGESKFFCGYKPEGCEDLKFHTTDRCNMWTGSRYEANYFKILKNQKWEQFKRYLTKLLDSMRLPEMELLTVNIEIPDSIRTRLEAPNYF